MNFRPLLDWLALQRNVTPVESPGRVDWRHPEGLRGVEILVTVKRPLDGDGVDVTIDTWDNGRLHSSQRHHERTVEDTVRWLEKRLYPTEHDLNEAWGV